MTQIEKHIDGKITLDHHAWIRVEKIPNRFSHTKVVPNSDESFLSIKDTLILDIVNDSTIGNYGIMLKSLSMITISEKSFIFEDSDELKQSNTV